MIKGPLRLVRSDKVERYQVTQTIFEWIEGNTYLTIDQVDYKGKKGAILCYYNPPVHQVGNPGLDAYLEGLNKIFQRIDELGFLLLYSANDPIHAGGDLKESLNKLDKTLALKKDQEANGATQDDIDNLYEWADGRLRKGIALHESIRKLAEHMRVVAVCGGGSRFGGSAEIPLMADYLVGDSRSGLCFSEAMIGLIPGWSGLARSLVKAGPTNATYMALTAKEVKAPQLKEIGIYNLIVDIPFPFPKKQKTDDPEADKANYEEALQTHNDKTGMLLLPKGLDTATCKAQDIPVVSKMERKTLTTQEEISQEVDRRKNPYNYSKLWGKPLKEVKEELAELGRPLAPQSVEALRRLLDSYDPANFDENSFVQREMMADARLYRDQKFREGLVATLEQKVADYREAS